MDYAYYNGSFSVYSEIRIPLTDRAMFFGDGVYDAAVGGRGKIYLFERHAKRLRDNAEKIGLKLGFSDSELFDISSRLISLSGYEGYFLYYQLSALGRDRRHARTDSGEALLAFIKKWTPPPRDRELGVCTARDMRYSLCNIKTLSLLPAALAATSAEKRGLDECVFIRDGAVCECAHSNLFIVSGDTLITPPVGEAVLPGITRARIIELSRSEGLSVLERQITKSELLCADTAFISSTSKLCARISSIDGTPHGKSAVLYEKISSLLYSDYESSVL
jgi:D-alanine transaminase